MEAVRLERV